MKTKGFIRACAFGSVCIFVIILLLTVGLSVSASEPVYIEQEFNLTSTDILTYDGFTSNNSETDLQNTNLKLIFPRKDYSSLYGEVDSITNQLSNIYLSDSDSITYDDSRFIAFTLYNDFLEMQVLPEGSFINIYNTVLELYVPYSSGASNLYGGSWNLYSNVVDIEHASVSGYDDLFTIDNEQYYLYEWSLDNNWQYIYFCTCPIYSESTLKTSHSLSNVPQLNYSSAFISANNSDGQSVYNNLVMDSGDWTFNNSSFTAPYNVSFNTGSIYPNGTISYSFFPNDYQIQNSTRYTITLGFTFDYSVNYKNWGAQNGVFDSTNELTNNKKTYSANFHYSNNGVEYIDIPLSTFINNGNTASYTFEEIFKHLVGDNTSYESVLLTSKELDYVEYNKFNVTCTAFISSGTESSGNVTEWYNPMNKKGYTTDSSGKVNKNPYNGSNGSDVSSVGSAPGTAGNDGDNSNNIGGGSSNGSGSADAYSSVGNITINNNNTAYGGNGNGGNGNGGGGSGGSETSEAAISMWNTFNPFKLIFNKLTGDVTNISDDVAETLGANGYISVLSTTFGFLPSECWTVLTWFLGATLAILIVGVILRILLDLL